MTHSSRVSLAAFALAAFLTVPGQFTAPPAVAAAQDLPSVADLADKLLPSVVEISVETKPQGGGDTPNLQMPEIPDNSPFKDFFDDFFKRKGKA